MWEVLRQRAVGLGSVGNKENHKGGKTVDLPEEGEGAWREKEMEMER